LINFIINLFLSIAIFLIFVLYFIEKIVSSITFLKKDFRNDIGSELRNILKYNCKYVLITSTLTNSNRLFGENYFNCQRIINFKNRAFRMLRDIIIAD
jgi:hypothetical protein